VLAIDSASADAHTYLGAVKLMYDLDWPGAERELSAAVALDPRSSVGYLWRGLLFAFTGRENEALIYARTGLNVDPLSLASNIEYGRALLFARKYDAAADQLKRILERDSASSRAHLLLGGVQQTANTIRLR
jgi:predicted Zn-dependent protease